MLTTLSGLEGALIGLALLVFWIVRQFSTRRVLSIWQVAIPLLLVYLGLQGLARLDATGWLLLGLNLALGMGLGVVRGGTFRVWTDASGEALMRGTQLTLVLWLATFAVKLGLSVVELRLAGAVPSANNALVLLPAAATLAAQALIVYVRSQKLRLAAA